MKLRYFQLLRIILKLIIGLNRVDINLPVERDE